MENKMTAGRCSAIFLVIFTIFLVACAPVYNQGIQEMPAQRMTSISTTLLSRDTGGLENAKSTEIIEADDGQTIELEAKPVVKEINGNKIRMYSYNGQIPGPLIKVKQGSTIYISFKNNIEMPTTIHWHGIRVDNKFDGVETLTEKAIEPGKSFAYELTFPDEGIYWYHPHIREDLQQELGLYGNIFVEPKEKKYFNLVDKETALILDDIRMAGNDVEGFNSQYATYTLMGRFGNVILINGQTDYNLDVKKGDIVRFYLTDAANTRTFNFKIQEHEMKLVGSDSGKFEKESFTDSVILGPGERYIVEILFDKEGSFNIIHENPLKTYVLGKINVADNKVAEEKAAQFSQLKENEDITLNLQKYTEYTNKNPDYEFVLTIDQQSMMRMVGMGFEEIEWEDIGHMAMMNRNSDERNVKWIIRDKKTGKENKNINYQVRTGDIKKIRIINDKNSIHPMQHPMHLHGQRFLVLSQDNNQNNNLAWKDTVLVPAGSAVDILVDFTNPGEWMFHCHIAEHLSSGMMSSFTVT